MTIPATSIPQALHRLGYRIELAVTVRRYSVFQPSTRNEAVKLVVTIRRPGDPQRKGLCSQYAADKIDAPEEDVARLVESLIVGHVADNGFAAGSYVIPFVAEGARHD